MPVVPTATPPMAMGIIAKGTGPTGTRMLTIRLTDTGIGTTKLIAADGDA
jgi:hypothetical protein